MIVVFPGVTIVSPSVLLIVRFAITSRSVVSVSSSVSRSSVTFAVLTILDVAVAWTSATAGSVMLSFAGKSARSLIPASVVPLVVTFAPPASTTPTDNTVSSHGNVSVMLSSVTSAGPSSVTMIV